MTYPTAFIGGTFSLGDPLKMMTAAAEGRTDDLDWFHPKSAFALEAQAHGVELVDPAEPFIWSTRLAGIESLADGLRGLPRWVDWYACGWALRNWWRVYGKRVNCAAHSHGGYGAIMAAALGQQFGCLMTVGTPVRPDMAPWCRLARQHVKVWIHIFSPNDPVQLAGEIGGGGPPVEWPREMPEADANFAEPTEEPDAHSKLHAPLLWTQRFWWNYLLYPVESVAP